MINPARKNRATTTIWPTHQVKSDVQGSLPSISVGSTNQAYMLPVINEILQTWILLEDILSAWKDGCRTADAINFKIVESGAPITICCCDNPSASSTVHPCARCQYVSQCPAMHESQEGYRICNRCSQKEKKTPAKRTRREFVSILPANTHAGHKKTFNNLKNCIHEEAEY